MEDQVNIDLFEAYEQQPPELAKVLSDFEEEHTEFDELNYEACKELLRRVEAIGYTFEYGLDAQPYDLRKIEK